MSTDKTKKTVVKSLSDFKSKYKTSITDTKQLARNSGFRSTGSITVDNLLNGGIPKGTMAEFWGAPGAGKTSLAIKMVSVCQKEGGTVGYVDLERGLDMVSEDPEVEKILTARTDEEHNKRRESWLARNGVDPFHPNFHLLDPEHGEELFSMLDDIVVNNLMDVVVVDSVANIITRAELDGDPGESHFGAVSRLMSIELKRLQRLFKDNRNTNIIFINQVRTKIGARVSGKKSFGSEILEHAVGTKIRFWINGRDDSNENDLITETGVKVDKSRYASAHTVQIYISEKRGIDTLTEVLGFALEAGYAYRAGAWYYFFDEPIAEDDFEAARKGKTIPTLPGYKASINGKEAVLEFMGTNGWEEKLTPLARKN